MLRRFIQVTGFYNFFIKNTDMHQILRQERGTQKAITNGKQNLQLHKKSLQTFFFIAYSYVFRSQCSVISYICQSDFIRYSLQTNCHLLPLSEYLDLSINVTEGALTNMCSSEIFHSMLSLSTVRDVSVFQRYLFSFDTNDINCKTSQGRHDC